MLFVNVFATSASGQKMTRKGASNASKATSAPQKMTRKKAKNA